MLQFENHGLKGGLWHGRVTGAETPPARIVLVHQGEVLAEARLTADGPKAWLVEVDLPGEALSDGVQTLLLQADDGAEGSATGAGALLLARLPVTAGRPLDHDLIAEITALRAELELVKRELRRLGARIAEDAATG
ncbi:MAG: hypothetical protein FJX25_13970 [Alphaproteobacteria bacterium]|nr:hypothetical protein [Alphaproteobacteria bacterium]